METQQTRSLFCQSADILNLPALSHGWQEGRVLRLLFRTRMQAQPAHPPEVQKFGTTARAGGASTSKEIKGI